VIVILRISIDLMQIYGIYSTQPTSMNGKDKDNGARDTIETPAG